MQPGSTPAGAARPPGTLHVVATPIGNLGDLSPRALETLRNVAAICAEDTRHTRQLLAHFGLERPLMALHQHNEDAQAAQLVARLLGGESLALGVSAWFAPRVPPASASRRCRAPAPRSPR